MAFRARLCALLVSVLAVSGVARAERAAPPLVNWSAPATYSPAGSSKIRALTDISSPVPFITTAPCRQYNSLLATPLLQGVNRAVPLTGAPCGIPASAVAVSVNITVFNITGATGNGVFKVDTVTPPAVAWINYPPTEAQRGNAGVVALNGSGQIIVQVAQGAGQVDFIVDTNGYYASAAANQSNSFKVINNGGATIPAIWGETTSTNVNATGVYGLASSTTGITDGVWGRNYSNGDLSTGVIGISEGTTGATVGVYGRSNSGSSGTIGTYGESLGTTGRGSGVYGFEASALLNSAGVRGVDYSGLPAENAFFTTAGVRGDSNSGRGVLGISQNTGVAGILVNSSGAPVASGFLGSNSFFASDSAGPPWGVFAEGNLGAFGAKHFVEPHPTDASRVIVYSSTEGRTVDTYFRGTARFVNHEAVIAVPEDFRIVTDENGLTVQLTPIGSFASMYVESRDLDRIVVKSSKDVQFDYLVHGVRRAFKDFQPVRAGHEFMPNSPDARIPLYLTEEAKQRLIANGTYHADGTVNLETAERVGWTKLWAERDAQAQAVAREAQKAANARPR